MKLKVVNEEVIEDKWFNTDHLKGNLKARSVKGGISTMIAQIISFIMNLAQTIIIARLLLPEDFGLIAMVSSITSFIIIFKDLGLSSAVIQKETLTQNEVSTVFWLNVLISLGIALTVVMISPILVYFYQEERLLQITLVFALNIFIVGLSLQHNALLKRQMRFNDLALIQLVVLGICTLTGILLAWLGFGYWSVVINGIIYSILQTVAVWILCDWRPNLTFDNSKINPFLKFGAGLTGFDVINHFSRNMDNIFVGKFVGSVALGLYSKAYQLLMLPITQLRNPLNSVALPALSSLQNDYVKYRSFYTKYLFILAFFSMPIVAYFGVFANELILIILGEQWTKAGILFQILAIAAFIQPVASTTGLILITTGRVKRYFNTGLINAFFMVSGFGLGVFMGGVKGVAISQIIVVYTLFIPMLYYNLHKTPISVSIFLKEISFPSLYAVLSCIAMFYAKYLLNHHSNQLSPIILCIVGFIVGCIVYLSLMYLIPKSKVKLIQLLDIKYFLGKKNKGKKDVQL